MYFRPMAEYYLRGVPEMACGFKLEDDNTFQFFLAYGALDRHGSGTWKPDGNRIAFQSKPWSGSDFALIESKKNDDHGITIQISDKNQDVLRYVYASLKNGEEGSWQPADQQGTIQFSGQPGSSISLLFEFSPERASVVPVKNTDHNYFEFRFEPWLVEFFFNEFTLVLTDDGLIGKHPMMDGDEFYYEKQ